MSRAVPTSDNKAPNSSLFGALLNRRMLVSALHGFSSGLPFYVLISMLPAWFRTEGVGLAEIAAFNWLRTPYSWKFAWAPLLDRFHLPFLSRRRDWALATQLGLVVLTATLGLFSPSEGVLAIAILVILVSWFSASQDIAIDAYRRELLPDAELGFGNAVTVNLYRVSGVVAGSLALFVADDYGWGYAHFMISGFMLVGVVATLIAPVLPTEAAPPRTLKEAVVGPFLEFFTRDDLKTAVLLLVFLFLYKLGDNLATTLASPFYLDLGFSLKEIGSVVKAVSLTAMFGGSLIGGMVMVKVGINKALWLFGCVQMASILGFAAVAVVGYNLWALGAAVLFEYLGVGLGTAAFVAFIARSTNKRFSATQYALFSSFIALPGIVVGSLAGLVIEAIGYANFFFLCTSLAVPGMLILFKVAPWSETVAGSKISHES